MESMSEEIVEQDQEYPHLAKAPIVEAVIEVRGRAGVPWDEMQIKDTLQRDMKDYPEIQHIGTVDGSIRFESGKIASFEAKDLGLQGIQFKRKDQKQIAHFNIDFFSFSRLNPYSSWDSFSTEALRLWEIHHHVLQQIEIQRVGVRFINRILLPTESTPISAVFKEFPSPVPDMRVERVGFIYHDVVTLPNQPYQANIIKTIQPASAIGQGPAVILDIDAFTEEPLEPIKPNLLEALDHLRSLKNSIFFNTVTIQFIKQFRGM